MAAAMPSVSMADTDGTDHTVIDIGGHSVPVLKEGLYDRYRSNPPLSVIREESPETDLSWFETIEKEKVDIGFESWSPNFYYENTKVTAIYTADIDRLRELLPDAVEEHSKPIQIWPGRGLVALTAYSYHYCDNDTYNEISLAIVTNAPDSSNLGPFSLVSQAMDKNFWGYVLKLPVDTELAKVRGVVGYNLPKWVTGIEYRVTPESIVFEVADAATGRTDFVLETAKLEDVSEEPSLVTNSFVNLDRNNELTTGYAVSRQLSYASSMDDGDVSLVLGSGSFSEYLRSLDLGEMVRYDYVPDFQSALYAPEPLNLADTH
jgi:hypothetical protein